MKFYVNLTSFLFLFSCMLLQAQENNKLEFKLSGRGLFDAAFYDSNDAAPDLTNGVHLADMRIGIKAYYGDWYFRGDVSYRDNKVGLKDFYMQYNFAENNRLRIGHYTVPFGLSSAYSSAKKEFLDEPLANVYQPGRRIGVSHIYYNKPLWVQYGVFADNSALTQSTDVSGSQGYMLAGRGVYRPIVEEDRALQFGISGIHLDAESAGVGNHRAVKYSKRFMSAVDKTKAVSVDIVDAVTEDKGTIESAAFYKNFQLGTQFYMSKVSRENQQSYNSNGFYLTMRGILFNVENYKYKLGEASIANPTNKNIELALGYGYLDLNDEKAKAFSGIGTGIYGGKMTHYNVGLSCYWNKYVTFRAEYDMFMVDKPSTPTQKVNALQFRMMYLF